jgi:hypothetical protein
LDESNTAAAKSGFSGAQVALIVLAAILLTVGLSYWIIRTYIIPSDFEPVELSPVEQSQLDDKLRLLGINPLDLLPGVRRVEGRNAGSDSTVDAVDSEGRLVPEKYAESSEKRNVRMNERELNALVASSPDLARRFAIDLSDNLASAKLLIPLDPDFPIMGGRTLRINAGLEIAYSGTQPVVMLRGVSIMGVPVPNAWIGNLKNVDLVQEFGGGPGFWNSFSAGVDMIAIEDGQLHINLKE